MKALLALLLLLVAAPAAAQDDWVLRIGTERPPAALFGDDRIVSLQKGAPAPFAGILMDTEAAARWSLREDWYQKQLVVNADLLRRTMWLELTAATDLRKMDQLSYERELAGMRKDLREQAAKFTAAQDRPFWRTGLFGFAAGTTLAGALATTIAILVH